MNAPTGCEGECRTRPGTEPEALQRLCRGSSVRGWEVNGIAITLEGHLGGLSKDVGLMAEPCSRTHYNERLGLARLSSQWILLEVHFSARGGNGPKEQRGTWRNRRLGVQETEEFQGEKTQSLALQRSKAKSQSTKTGKGKGWLSLGPPVWSCSPTQPLQLSEVWQGVGDGVGGGTGGTGGRGQKTPRQLQHSLTPTPNPRQRPRLDNQSGAHSCPELPGSSQWGRVLLQNMPTLLLRRQGR